MISGEISRFQDPFQISAEIFMVVRGRPNSRARSVVPVPVRPSSTQRVPERVCVKLREYASLTLARVMFHRYEVQYILQVLLDRVYWGCWRGCYCCSLARQPYFSMLLVSRYRKLTSGTDFTGILQRRQDQSIHSRNNFDIIMSY